MTVAEEEGEAAPPRPRRRRSLASRFVRTRPVQRATALAARGAMGFMSVFGPRRSGAVASAVARRVAPLIGESRLALANLAHAFPEKSEDERRSILSGVWDNVARTAAEYAHIQRARARDIAGVVEDFGVSWSGEEHFDALRDDGRPGIVFTAHLANWELLALASALGGLNSVALYRPPKNPFIHDDLMRWRAGLGRFIPSRPGAILEVASALRQGAHFGMLVDQCYLSGPRVPFFGRPAATSPTVAKLAREFDCPVHGARAIRLKGGGFRLEMTPALDLPRDSDGRVDVTGATAAMTAVVEGWVREYPEQWLWLHNRWRVA